MNSLKKLLVYKERKKQLDHNSDNENSVIINRFHKAFGNDIDIPVIWYNPWRYQFEEEPVLPLLDAIKEQIPPSSWSKVLSSIRSVVEDPKLRVIGKAALGVGSLMGPGWLGALSNNSKSLFGSNKSTETIKEIYNDFSKIHEQIDISFEELLKAYPTNNGKAPEKLVVFIDDLDRCEGKYVVKILESLKLHLLNKHCVFVLGAAVNRVLDTLSKHEICGDHNSAKAYLEKIIQLPVHLPPIFDQTLERYIKNIAKQLLPTEAAEFRNSFNLIKTLSAGNPRKLKLFLAWYTLQISLIEMVEGLDADDKAGKLVKNSELLLKIKILQYSNPTKYRIPDDFNIDLPSNSQTEENNNEDSEENVQDRKPYESLPPFIGLWLKKDDFNKDQLILLLALTTDVDIAKLQFEKLEKERSIIHQLQGKWEGFYVEPNGKSKFFLTISFENEYSFSGLSKEDGHLGDAEIFGEINLDKQEITFTKQYLNPKHSKYHVEYNGVWDKNFNIKGRWNIDFDTDGTFNMKRTAK
ncbi:MAG: hypothetical protein GY777_27110 [Candidatus Brocadiaceae bacterium]|nr:hypothetical protein [Candidatus Brocadiaceae bacterium]